MYADALQSSPDVLKCSSHPQHQHEVSICTELPASAGSPEEITGKRNKLAKVTQQAIGSTGARTSLLP